MSNALKMVKVKFSRPASVKTPLGYRPITPTGITPVYTYLLPAGVDADVGDELIVPVGPSNLSRRVTVVEVSDVPYKFALGKVELF